MDCTTYRSDEGVIDTWAKRNAQGDVCPRILVTRSALVDKESRRTVHFVSECEDELAKSIVISTAPLCRGGV